MIIDKNGRVFGRINVIDLSLVLFLFCFIPVAFFAYKVMVSKNFQVATITIDVRFENIDPELSDLIAEGDVELDSSDRVVGKIEKILSRRPSNVVLTTEIEKLTLAPHPIKKDVVVSMALSCEKKDRVWHWGTNIIKVGNDIKFSTDTYNISGSIIRIKVK